MSFKYGARTRRVGAMCATTGLSVCEYVLLVSVVLGLGSVVPATTARRGGTDTPVHRGGIDVRCDGDDGVDFASERLYHDAAVDGRRVLFVKGATTHLSLVHNQRNSVQ